MTMHLLEQPLSPGFFNSLPGEVCSKSYCGKGQPGAPDSDNTGSYARSGEIYGVMWSPRYGACCPQCGTFTKAAYKHTPWRDNHKTRYHACPKCSFRFKSIAKDIVVDPYPTPDQLRYLRKYK